MDGTWFLSGAREWIEIKASHGQKYINEVELETSQENSGTPGSNQTN